MQKKNSLLPDKLNSYGTIYLAIAVINSAVKEGLKKNDWSFFDTENWIFYGQLAGHGRKCISGAQAKKQAIANAKQSKLLKRGYRPRPYSIR